MNMLNRWFFGSCGLLCIVILFNFSLRCSFVFLDFFSVFLKKKKEAKWETLNSLSWKVFLFNDFCLRILLFHVNAIFFSPLDLTVFHVIFFRMFETVKGDSSELSLIWYNKCSVWKLLLQLNNEREQRNTFFYAANDCSLLNE